MISTDKIISKSILASVISSIGCTLYLLSPNAIIGSLLISLSLFIIMRLDCNLFTFKSGFLSKSVDFRRLSLILIINLLVTLLLGFIVGLFSEGLSSTSSEIAMSKLSTNFFELIIKSIVAGFIMTFAVNSSVRQPDHYLIPILCIFGIYFTDCQHCITDMFYYGASDVLYDNFSTATVFIILTTIFNFIGCNLYNLIMNKSFIYNENI